MSCVCICHLHTQNPTLDLLPHIAAPGDDVPVRNKDGSKDTASGVTVSVCLCLKYLLFQSVWQAKQCLFLFGDRLYRDSTLCYCGYCC